MLLLGSSAHLWQEPHLCLRVISFLFCLRCCCRFPQFCPWSFLRHEFSTLVPPPDRFLHASLWCYVRRTVWHMTQDMTVWVERWTSCSFESIFWTCALRLVMLEWLPNCYRACTAWSCALNVLSKIWSISISKLASELLGCDLSAVNTSYYFLISVDIYFQSMKIIIVWLQSCPSSNTFGPGQSRQLRRCCSLFFFFLTIKQTLKTINA